MDVLFSFGCFVSLFPQFRKLFLVVLSLVMLDAAFGLIMQFMKHGVFMSSNCSGNKRSSLLCLRRIVWVFFFFTNVLLINWVSPLPVLVLWYFFIVRLIWIIDGNIV